MTDRQHLVASAPGVRRVAGAVATATVAGLLAACGESAVQPTPPPSRTAAQAPLHPCTLASLPEPGFVPDTAHAGTLSLGRYSLNGDVQGAMVVDGFETSYVQDLWKRRPLTR